MKRDTLIDSSWAPTKGRIKTQEQPFGRLVSYSMPAPDLTPSIFLNAAQGRPRFFWQRGDSDELYAGFGTAAQLFAWGEQRFEEIHSKAAMLFEDAQILGPHLAPVLPRLFGGFSFRDDFAPDNTWSVFHPAHFVLPHYQFFRHGDSSWLTINAIVSEMEDLSAISSQLHQALNARYRQLSGTKKQGDSGSEGTKFAIDYPMKYETWAGIIDTALQTMQSSVLKKVVLARVCELKSSNIIDICRALDFLNEHFRDCTRFLFEPRAYHAFYGATPELLVKANDKDVATMALAGSMPRGKTEVEDRSNALALFQNAKERHEHQLVVDALRRRLEPISTQLEIPAAPRVYSLSYIQHLLTPVAARLRNREGVLRLVKLLHPTPAMGGSPRERALEFIKRYEPVPRGWYAAPVGWLDSRMDGEFVVAIRSAVAQERRVWCYAGAGIVPESKADIEWAETDLKFQPMLRALGITGHTA